MPKSPSTKIGAFSIGIYTGPSPFALRPHPGAAQPVITFGDVDSHPSEFVADPFMVPGPEGWYLFFETLNSITGRGEIGLATSSNAVDWSYQQIVLTEPFHLSYPHVFCCDGKHYMIPETIDAEAVSLYEATDFPTTWRPVQRLLEGTYADPTVFQHNGKWWMFACSRPYKHDELRLFVSEELTGEWREHPLSPVVSGNNRIARPAGRVLVSDDSIVRFAQDCFPIYGSRVRAFEIRELSDSSYQEEESLHSPILEPAASSWASARMHHVDAHQLADGSWIACVDGGPDSRDVNRQAPIAQ